jgi:ArsR family transcriptional regulator
MRLPANASAARQVSIGDHILTVVTTTVSMWPRNQTHAAGLDRQLGSWQTPYVLEVDVLKALGNEKRLAILAWLADPEAHFPPQRDGDLVADGVCSVFIADKLGVSQPTASEHLRLLTATGLLTAKRIRQWTFYRRNERRIAAVKKMFQKEW